MWQLILFTDLKMHLTPNDMILRFVTRPGGEGGLYPGALPVLWARDPGS